MMSIPAVAIEQLELVWSACTACQLRAAAQEEVGCRFTPDGAFRLLAWFDSQPVERLFRAE
jgi:hypothetical protein